MTSTWFRILKDYPNNFGPTIPFILGALRRPVGHVLSHDESRQQLCDLLVAMRDQAPHPYRVVIQGCTQLGEPIITLTDVEPGELLRFDSPSTEGRALYFGSFYGLQVYDFQSLINGLWDRYQTVISQGLFSRRHGTWQTFDETELAKLNSYCGIE